MGIQSKGHFREDWESSKEERACLMDKRNMRIRLIDLSMKVTQGWVPGRGQEALGLDRYFRLSLKSYETGT